MSIFNRIFGGGREDDAESDDAPKEDAPTDIDAAPPQLSSPPRGSPARGGPLPSAEPGDEAGRSYHPALSYTPPAGVRLPGQQSQAETGSEDDTKPQQPAPAAPNTRRSTFGNMAAKGPAAKPGAGADDAVPASQAPRVKTEPMPKPPPPGTPRRLTPLPPGATTRAGRPGKPLRRQTPAQPRAQTAPAPRAQTDAPPRAQTDAPPQRAQTRTPTPARAKTTPGSGAASGAVAGATPAPARTPAPTATPAGKSDGKVQAALDGMDTQQLRSNLDDAFSGLEAGGNGAQAVEPTERDLESVRELFEDMAADYMARVRDFMIEVKWGEATPSWAGRCEPVVRSLRRFADKVGYAELSLRLKNYGAQLAAARRAGGAMIAGDPAKALTAAFDALAELTPAVFELDKERDRREPIIVESLLRQVPVRRVALDKLHAAGLHKLKAFFSAKASDMASLADVSVDTAQQIVACFAEYRERSDASLSAADVNAEHRRLKSLVADLRREQQAYERAARQWSAEALANKRHYRQTREQALLRIHVSLARLGQLDELRAIERQSYPSKLDSLQQYLARSAAAGLGRKTTSTGEGDEQRP